MKEDREGFLQPKIDFSNCIHCHKCEHVCPIINQQIVQNNFATKAFAAINKNNIIRKESSSGGVFYALAKWVIDQNGVVFGARWNDDWEVVHDFTETLDGVKAFMKSKYVQSRIGPVYKQAKKFLEEGRWVLFSGTPCQLAGLRAFLGEKYDRLIQVDLICHGVPSPKVWKKYLKSYFPNEKLLSVNMRDKTMGWEVKHIHIVSNKGEFVENEMKNPFYFGYLHNVFLRMSCYHCIYRNYHRASDITIADYWGVGQECPKMYDGKGTSIVFCHTEKSIFLFNQLQELIYSLPQTKESAIRFNRGMEFDEIIPNKRSRFFRLFKVSASFKLSEYPIFKDTIPERVMRKLHKGFNNWR